MFGKRTNFYSDLFLNYSNITFPSSYDNLSKIDTNIQWYLSDSENKLIYVARDSNKYILDIDLSAAFPTICNSIFEKCEFLDKLNSIEDKKERNIFLATNLKNYDSTILPMLNVICKMVILGLIFDTDSVEEKNDILILELKKDGCLISVNPESYYRLKHLKESDREFTSFIFKHNFKYHITDYEKYLRSNKTSYFVDKNDVTIKGQYKYLPPSLLEIVKYIFFTNLSSNVDFNSLNKIYSLNYYKICVMNNLTEILNQWYICSNGKILNNRREYVSLTQDVIVEPFSYIQTFLYPSILSTKL